MAKVWLTYAWSDNDDGDVDYVAQELRRSGVEVQIDRQVIRAGLRLWQQIEQYICDPAKCDAWMIYATSASLSSEACREELAYALARALDARGEVFPLIGLFPATIAQDLIPAAIRSRFYVSLTDPHWVERVSAAAERRHPRLVEEPLAPYRLRVHANSVRKGEGHCIEVHPRAGAWSPFIVGIPVSEKTTVNPSLLVGPRGRVPSSGVVFGCRRGPDPAGNWWLITAQGEATPTQSLYIMCDTLPSTLVFGVDGGIQHRARLW